MTQFVGVGKGALAPCSPSSIPLMVVGRFALPTQQFAAISLVGQITKSLSSPSRKNIPLNMSGKSVA
jgi:hypothetical protein